MRLARAGTCGGFGASGFDLDCCAVISSASREESASEPNPTAACFSSLRRGKVATWRSESGLSGEMFI